MNINVLTLYCIERTARHPLVINNINHERVANLLYWKNHYAPITSIYRLFSDITKHVINKQLCLPCLGHFHRNMILRKTKCFAFATNSCRCSMCFLRHAPNKRKSNLINISIVFKNRLSFMRTSSPVLSRPIVK